MRFDIKQGDWIDVLRTMPDESAQCCVTSPPYWGLRDYGTAKWVGGDPDCDHTKDRTIGVSSSGLDGGKSTTNHQKEAAYRDICGKCGATRVDRQLGLERTPEEYVAKMVEGFREVRRVLRKDGTLWLNLGDTYAANRSYQVPDGKWCDVGNSQGMKAADMGCKPKDLVGIPWLVAFALRADGWYLRQDIIWSKPNPMPESVTDRCTKAHEYLFLLSKSERYYCDMDAIKERCIAGDNGSRYDSPQDLATKVGLGRGPRKVKIPGGWDRGEGAHGTIHRDGRTSAEYQDAEVSPFRNKRSVWEIATSPFPEAHFATFPPKLVEPCILAGSKSGDTVLDPFNGAGTTGLVATRFGRNYIGIELNPEYVAMAGRRIQKDMPLLNQMSLLPRP